MKKFWFSLMILVAAFGFAQTAPGPAIPPYGSLCDNGNQPAATLLLPYFEVDSVNSTGLDTLIAVTNLSLDETIAHVTVFNVDSYPVFDFNIYLTPYDVVTFSMRNLLVNGNYPNNACTTPTSKFTHGHVDCNGDGIYFNDAWTANDGMFSVGTYAMDLACYPPASGTILTDRQCMLSVGSYDGWNPNYVGYVLIDNNLTCSGAYATYDPYYTPNYLDSNNDGIGDHSVIEMSNALFGDMFYYDAAGSQADGYPLVHIEAFGERNGIAGHNWGMDPDDFDAWGGGAGVNTFYNKYNYWGSDYAGDLREPLPIRWAFRYIGNVAFDGGTMVDVWRSHHWDWGPYRFSMSGGCNFGGTVGVTSLVEDLYVSGGSLYLTDFGLWRPTLIVYDEEENTTQGEGGPSPPPSVAGFDNVFLEAQRVPVTEAEGWPLVDESGWIGISFDTDKFPDWLNFAYGCPRGVYAYGCTFDQSWLNVRYQARNKYTVGLSGASYLNGCSLVWDDVNSVFDLVEPVY